MSQVTYVLRLVQLWTIHEIARLGLADDQRVYQICVRKDGDA